MSERTAATASAVPTPEAGRPSTRRSAALRGLAVVAACAVAGVPVGLAWARLAPQAGGEVVDGGVRLATTLTDPDIGADATLGALGLVAGLVTALLLLRARRVRAPTPVRDDVVDLLAVAVGGLAGSVVAWRCGMAVEPASLAEAARGAPVGAVVEVPLRLRALGVLTGWPLAAVLTLTLAPGRPPPAPAPGAEG